MMNITFVPLAESHFSLLLKWLEAPHVKKWWDKDVHWTSTLIQKKYSDYIKGYKLDNGIAKPINAYIICVDEKPVGYIQIYNAYDFARETPLSHLPESLAAFDVLIGEADYLKQGIGSKAITLFLDQYATSYSHVFVEPDSNNIAAIRVYEKVGFKKIFQKQDTKELWMLWENSAVSNAEQKVILIADPKVLAIPIQENNEPLIDLRNQNVLAFGPSPEVPNNTDYTKMRKSVYDKLLVAQYTLPDGIKFRLYEAYRSLKLQKTLFQNRYSIVQQANPDWTHEAIFIETTKLVSPVINLDGSTNVPPHSTGAAIDICLIDVNGQCLDMGIALEDWIKDLDGSFSMTNSTKISEAAQQNRKIMSAALEAVGFVNYPTEYWHWSYGDRYWAYNKHEPHAIYGVIN